MGRSVLDDLGQEVTGIAAPVSICMALTVALVRLLNPEGESNAGSVSVASIYYSENDADSTGTKLSGSVINALIFVGIIAALTFVMVLLFKYGYTRIIYIYMAFSGFTTFFVLCGIIAIEVLQKAGAHMDWISFAVILFNFAAVGAATLFVLPAPLLMKQCYLVATGVSLAFVFTWIPQWTTWVLLVAMALYDIAAVLIPGGPLRVLVEMAQEREEEIPALVYQARAVRREGGGTPGAARQSSEEVELQRRSPGARPAAAGAVAARRQALAPASAVPPDGGSSGRSSPDSAAPSTPLLASCHASPSRPGAPLASVPPPVASAAGARGAGAAPLPQPQAGEPASELRVGAGTHLTPAQAAELAAHPSEATAFALPEAIKLGLGDFIFYSVLVGRAAMYDMLTVFACFIAILAGLGCTLLWLAVARKALPALPVSIALAVAFYFISRFVMEPVILPMTLRLVFF